MTTSLSTQVDKPETAAEQEFPGAVRSGAQLGLAMGAGIVATYLFYLVAGRLLGPSDYGTLAALLALVTLASLPFQSLQMALSRDVSRLRARDEADRALAVSRAFLRFSGVATIALVVLIVAISIPLADILQLDSAEPMAFVAVALAAVVVAPVLLGDLQGRQEFGRLAVATAFPVVFRFLLFVVLAVVGWRLYGALAAIAIGGIVGLLVPVWWRRELLAGIVRRRGSVGIRPYLVGLVPVAVGLLAISALINIDLPIVKARLTSEDAGIYGAAAAFGRVAFFLPMAIVGVLFPRVAARHARGQSTEDVLGRVIVLTVGFCAALFLVYTAIGGPLVRFTYGSEFERAVSLLGIFGIGMTCFSLANVLVSYHLAQHDHRFAWAVAAAAVCQAVALALVPASLKTFIWVNASVGASLLVAHEVLMGTSATAVVAGVRHFHAELAACARSRRRRTGSDSSEGEPGRG